MPGSPCVTSTMRRATSLRRNGMGMDYVRYFLKHMHEDEARLKRGWRS